MENWTSPPARRGWAGGSRTVTRGIDFAILAAVMSGVAVFIGAYGVREFPSAALYTTLRNTLVGLVLLGLLLHPARLAELRRVTSRQGIGLVLLGIIGGSIPFVLFFEGLSHADSGSAAFLQKTLFLWVAVLAILFLRERLRAGHIAALGLLLISQVVLGGRGSIRLGSSEMFILIATFFWSAEVVLANRLLSEISSALAATARMALGATILLGYCAITGQLGFVSHLSLIQWAWVIGPGFLLLGYVATWYAALKHAPATTVTCVLTIGAPITAILSAFISGALPRPEAILGYAILIVGVLLFTVLSTRTSDSSSKHRQQAVQGNA